MQRSTLTLLLLLLTATAWTQVPVPGTFTARPGSGTYVYGAPILTPPEASFGSGLTGPIVVNHVPIVVATPENVPVEPSAIAQSQDIATAAAEQGAGAAPPRRVAFDYIVAPSSGIYAGAASGVGDRSLGQVAESMRKGPPPTQRSFTNDDILRMNSVSNGGFPMPSGAAPQPQTQPPPQTQPQQPPHNRAGMQPRSPFSPPVNNTPVQAHEVSTQQ